MIGAGVLRLDIVDFVRVVATLRATGTQSSRAKANAIRRFGQFFLGELWQTYGIET